MAGNQIIEAQGATRAIGVLGAGPCQPVIDGNVLITAGGDAMTVEADGVSCQANAGGEGSRCTVLGNQLIQASSSGSSSLAAGVACKDGGCVRVARNVVQATLGADVVGVWLLDTGTTVEQNRISGGCGLQTSSGVLSDDSFARLENNLIAGGSCTTGAPSPRSMGVRIYSAAGPNEINIHSNTIDAGGNAGACVSIGVELGFGPDLPPTTPRATLRNNILRGGACGTRSDFSEVFKNANDPLAGIDLSPLGAAGIRASRLRAP